MALRVLMTKKKLDEKRKALEELNQRKADFSVRESELEKAIEEALTDEEKQLPAKTVITLHPTVIKRPLIEWEDGKITVGFDEDDILRRI